MTSFNSVLAGERIDLAGWRLLKSGSTRNIHENDELPGILLKTLKPETVDAAGHFRAYEWWKKGRPHGAYFAFRRGLLLLPALPVEIAADREQEQDDRGDDPLAIGPGKVAHLVATQIFIDFADEGFGRIGGKRQGILNQ